MKRPRILVVGGGFAGMECVHRLERRLTQDEAEITLVTPWSHQLYLPLLPHVAAGVLTPRRSPSRCAAWCTAARSYPGGRSGWTRPPRPS